MKISLFDKRFLRKKWKAIYIFMVAKRAKQISYCSFSVYFFFWVCPHVKWSYFHKTEFIFVIIDNLIFQRYFTEMTFKCKSFACRFSASISLYMIINYMSIARRISAWHKTYCTMLHLFDDLWLDKIISKNNDRKESHIWKSRE